MGHLWGTSEALWGTFGEHLRHIGEPMGQLWVTSETLWRTYEAALGMHYGGTLKGPLGDHRETIGRPFGDHWGSIEGLLGDHWVSIGEKPTKNLDL